MNNILNKLSNINSAKKAIKFISKNKKDILEAKLASVKKTDPIQFLYTGKKSANKNYNNKKQKQNKIGRAHV